jgi:hypothetical protein
MNRFPDILRLSTYANDGECRTFRVDAPFRIGGETVPEGFLTDGASIPTAFWPIFSSTGRAFYPGVAHDFRYSVVSRCDDRAIADEELLNGLKDVGMGWMRRHLIYRAVRLFGWKFWKVRPKHECLDLTPD